MTLRLPKGSWVSAVLLAGITLLATACGPNCQSACQQIHGPAPDYCGIVTPGKDPDASRKDCVSECEFALTQAGEVGDYNPFEPITTGASATLDNEKQAALWMECVDSKSCTDLSDGYCAPSLF